MKNAQIQPRTAPNTPEQPLLPETEGRTETEAERTGVTPEMRAHKEDPKGAPHSDRHRMERAYIDHLDKKPG
jgi:hypothetical protein